MNSDDDTTATIFDESLPVNQTRYRVTSVEKIPAPDGMSGDNWYQYVIGAGASQLVGRKPGTLHTVTDHAQMLADEMSARATRTGSTYAPRMKK
jgi:hypothetical protein